MKKTFRELEPGDKFWVLKMESLEDLQIITYTILKKRENFSVDVIDNYGDHWFYSFNLDSLDTYIVESRVGDTIYLTFSYESDLINNLLAISVQLLEREQYGALKRILKMYEKDF